jgi:hypothetical protein
VSRLWNNTIQLIRRLLAAQGGVGQPNLSEVAQLHYLKVAEVQRRGLTHFHCVLRLDGPDSDEMEPPPWATVELLERVIRSSIERVPGIRRQSPQCDINTRPRSETESSQTILETSSKSRTRHLGREILRTLNKLFFPIMVSIGFS